jgi:hypothetical protein
MRGSFLLEFIRFTNALNFEEKCPHLQAALLDTVKLSPQSFFKDGKGIFQEQEDEKDGSKTPPSLFVILSSDLEASQHHELIAVSVNAVDPRALDIGEFLPDRRDVNINRPSREILPSSPDQFDQVASLNNIGFRLVEAFQDLPLQGSEFDVVAVIGQGSRLGIAFYDRPIAPLNVNFCHCTSSISGKGYGQVIPFP